MPAITHAQGTTLVLGGTGKTGRRVADRLTARGLPIRIGSRSGQPPFDWENQATWAPALESVTAVYMAYAPDAGFPGAADAVAEIATASGRDITYVPVTARDFESGMVAQGLPAEFAALLTGLFTEVLDGRGAYVADGVRRALGRAPATAASSRRCN